ncbi:MAG TPA: hypothetical protein VHI13_04825 [Candidatus Kapabacteria bacterium]|nr:hypothetical protein [Candidatus Kapabacteria bacterium]
MAHARGAVPPPPPTVNGGIGDWLGSGPLFGFDDPLGHDFYGGDGESGGTDGFEWDPTGLMSGDGGDNVPAGSCGSCTFDCQFYNRKTHVCDQYCCCRIMVPNGSPHGITISGSCMKTSSKWRSGVCCKVGDQCSGDVP